MSATDSAAAAPAVTYSVTTLFAKQQENALKAMIRDAIVALAERYSFSAEDAIKWLEVERPLTMEEKKMARKAKSDDESSTGSKKKEPPLPWMGIVDPNLCHAVAFRYQLFTQCPKGKKVGNFCAACDKAAKEEANGLPPCGTVNERLAQPNWAEYEDSKKRKPAQYAKVLYKLKFTLQDAVLAAQEKGLTIPSFYMEEYVPPAGKGLKEVTTGDGLFDSLVENASGSTASSTSSRGKRLTPEERAARDAQKALDKKEKEEATALKKKHTETAKAYAGLGRSVEDIVIEGVPRDIAEAAVQKYNETQEKKAETLRKREEAKAAKKAEKEAEKVAKKAGVTVQQVVVDVPEPVAEVVAEPVVAPEPTVKVFRINLAGEVGKKGQEGFIYLRGSDNAVYDADTKVPIGIWDTASNKIVFDEVEEEEEEETL